MMNTRTVEIMVGLFVAIGIASLFLLAMKASNFGTYNVRDGYVLVAQFENIGGLKVQSPVNAGGVRVGRVVGIEYDQDLYEARVRMMIDPRYNRFPKDTAASIFTSGLLGEQYVNLDPGGDEDYLADGDRIRLTQSALVLEKLIGQFLFSMAESSDSR